MNLRALRAMVLAALMALLGGCATAVRAPSSGVEPNYAIGESWARVLTRHVDAQGRVDFAGLAQDRSDLDRFVKWVYETGPKNQPQLFASRAAVLAYHLNAYNALAMYNVIEAGMPQALSSFGERYDFFYRRKLRVGGEEMSLYDYENNVIRPLGEERIHFALNCMAVSCPRLPREPFAAANLEQQLARESRLFFGEARHFAVDDATKSMRLSAILQFYPEDFLAHAPSLVQYVARQAGRKVPDDYTVSFTPYDWTINRQPPR